MRKSIMLELLAIILYVLFIYIFCYYGFVPGGNGCGLLGLIFVPCSIAVSARAIFSLDKIKRRIKNVFMCLNIFVGIIIFLINYVIAVETIGDWGAIGMAG